VNLDTKFVGISVYIVCTTVPNVVGSFRIIMFNESIRPDGGAGHICLSYECFSIFPLFHTQKKCLVIHIKKKDHLGKHIAKCRCYGSSSKYLSLIKVPLGSPYSLFYLQV
jgi:hypothetical protein